MRKLSLEWVPTVGLPPVGAGRGADIGQVGVPVTVQLKPKLGETLVVSTSATVAVQVLYEDSQGVLSARVWLPMGTWRAEPMGAVQNVVLTPPAVPFPGVPEVSIWMEQLPAAPKAEC